MVLFLDFGMSDLEKEPFDLGIENFALRIETSPASVPTSEQVHSRGTEHIFCSSGVSFLFSIFGVICNLECYSNIKTKIPKSISYLCISRGLIALTRFRTWLAGSEVSYPCHTATESERSMGKKFDDSWFINMNAWIWIHEWNRQDIQTRSKSWKNADQKF